MEAFAAMPTIKASELAERARNYADDLAKRLEQLDAEYRRPEGMSEQTFEELRKAHDGRLPGPTVREFHGRFQRLFYEAIASQYLIIPDET
jgi:hypothetical protein